MNRQKKSLLNQTYSNFLRAGFGLEDAKTLKGIIDEKLMGFGTTSDEKIMSSAELKELIRQQKIQTKGMDLQWKIKPLSHYTSTDENTAVFADELFLKIVAGAETVNMYMRSSIVLSYFNDKWKVIHWHGSKPEQVQSDEDTFGLETWKKKAEALEKVVLERTEELVEKNKELEIETSLERLRSVAMSMKKRDDMLSVCKTISQQLQKLGVKNIRNIQTAIFYEERGSYMNYQFYAKHNKTFITETVYTDHKVQKAFATQMLKGKGKFYITHIKGGKKLKDFIAYQKSTNVFIDKHLYTASSLSYYWYSLGPVALGISSYLPLTVEDENLFKRFLNVFELTYRRYLDIEKAEAQTREAQIETALERVRSCSMAMHQTSELQEVIQTVHKELLNLKLSIDGGSFIVINKDVDTSLRFWGAGGTADTSEEVILPDFKMPFVTNLTKGIKKRTGFFTEEFSQKEKKQFFTKLFKHKPWSELSSKRKKETLSAPGGYTRSVAVSKHTSIVIINHQGKKFSNAENDILKRFAKVFEQTYIRFLDLQKAEAQARESQIEAAMEKVRSSSLAMHHSKEMQRVVNTVIDQLQKLNIVLDTTNILIFNNKDKLTEFWTGSNSTGEQLTTSWQVPYFNISYYKAIRMAHEKGQEIFSVSYSFKEKNRLFTHLFTHSDFDKLNEDRKKFILKSPRATIAAAIVKDTAIQIISYSRNSFSTEEIEILKRFSRVFNQAYTRFLDLQKAEAQAREAQIEAALERVRSRSMAMHASKELKEVAKEMRNQFSLLGLKELETCAIHLWNQSSNQMEAWAALRSPDNTGEIIESETRFDIKGIRILEESYQKYRSGKKDYVIISDAIRAKEFFKAIKKIDSKAYHFLADRTKNIKPGGITAYWSVSDFNGGSLVMVTVNPPDENSRSLLKRFANVFGQAYQRFKDLQKAEAQAREAEIQLALERIRARTMAMHTSDELAEVAVLLLEQVKNLGIATYTSGFDIWDKEKQHVVSWMSNPNGEVNPPLTMNIHDSDQHLKTYKAWKNHELFFENEITGQALKKHYLYLHTLPSYRDALIKSESSGIKTPARMIHNIAFFKQGFLLFITTEPCPQYRDIFIRFAKVFEQTYTRFLDLQKAEAQAREAKIEAALEKIRSRSLGMHHSNELKEVIAVVFENLNELKVTLGSVAIWLFDKQTMDSVFWVATDLQHPDKISLPYDKNLMKAATMYRDSWQAWLSGKSYYNKKYNKQQKDKYFKYVFSNNDLKTIPQAARDLILKAEDHYGSLIVEKNAAIFFDSWNGATYDEQSIAVFQRTAKVFEQAYIRFLDLKKAEAQAREGQIQLALERVRARAMAMQSSEELGELIVTLFTELSKLDLVLTRSAIWLFEAKTNDARLWMANSEDASRPVNYLLPYHQHPTFLAFLKGWKERKIKWEYQLEGQAKKDWDDFLFSETGLSKVPEIIKEGMRAPEKILFSASFNNFGGIHVASLEPLSDEHFNILLRFNKVFELSYTRFNDLKQAEAQAREAQIELGLERVRARAMAMQTSEELNALIGIVFTELTKLDLVLTRSLIILYDAETKGAQWWMANSEAPSAPMNFFVKYTNLPFFNTYRKAWEHRDLKWQYKLEGKNKIVTDNFLFNETELKRLPGFVIEGMKAPHKVYLNASFNNFGNLTLATLEPLSENHFDILLRFAKVFDLTYTRFNDLQKAEAQAREAQIEAALERVRSRSMAMHKSDELKDVIRVVLEQFVHLNIKAEHAGFYIDYKVHDDMHIWLADPNLEPFFAILPYFDTPTWKSFLDAKAKGKILHTDLLDFNEKNKFYKSLFKLFEVPEEAKKFYMECKGLAVSTVLLDTIGLYIENFSAIPYTDEENEILIRFGKVFQQAYTRFLDLQKAEAQARESQIQLALERVRARTMVMQKSNELLEVINIFSDQLTHLNIYYDLVSFGVNDQAHDFKFWLASSGQPLPVEIKVPYYDNPAPNRVIEAMKKGLEFFADTLTPEESNRWIQHLIAHSELRKLPDKVKNYLLNSPGFARSTFILKNINLYIGNYKNIPYTDEENDIFKRFAQSFEQSYTRFLDLQKAEAQAREAQIEAGLERVRSRAMAMQTSEELSALIGIVFAELTKLDVNFTRCAILIYESDKKGLRQWMVNSETPSAPMSFYVAHTSLPYLDALMKGWVDRTLKWEYVLEGKDKFVTDEYLLKETELSRLPESVIAGMRTPEKIHISASFNNFGCVTLASLDPLSADNFDILLRFANVFDLTYTRFNDLQVAEARAREAQIEAALERVRGRTMAMQKSDELLPTAEIMFDQLKQLGAELQGVAFAICDKDSTIVQKWTSIGNFSHPYDIEPGERRMYEAWKNQSGMYEEVYEGEKQKKYYELFMAIPEFRQGLQKIIDLGFPIPTWQKNYAVPFKNGYVLFIVTKPFNETQIFIRFGKVFEQTYTRFLDLQKAEAAAREAIKQAALDRIRADIAAMRTTKDLDRITPLIWNELTILGIPFIRCGVFIMDDEAELIHTFLSTPDGQAITAFHLPYSTPGNISLVLKNWQNNKSYIDHWDENIFMGFAHTLVTQGALSSVDDYMKTFPAGGFYLHFLPFLQGMLYVGNANKLSDDEINLIQSLADAFSTAYARYEDFNKLEAAKKQVDSTLTELQATQKQLIQSEKMASLGELTAGIAHEIQNPLNFVNNFSEVSTELIDEMKSELDKGDAAEAKLIADDLKQNLEKINHHGKRADAIVKGMLQHSRTSTGKKEPTDINALCDEYLRLSYHGMRARDKSFNVKFETAFDESLPKINVVAQDIGRVILNLINNAFYAVSEKTKIADENYKPLVSVVTKKINDKVEISVKDNGNGIPDNIKDKIFQPFFTTKPTGQGTGLGLSLSYDIIKAHGGEIRVETKNGEGSIFKIQLPIS